MMILGRPGEVCDGEAATVLLPGPSLTEGWPATNPSLRLLEFDSKTYELLDAHTYTADLHSANKAGSKDLDWKLEYAFKKTFGMADMSAASFEALNAKLAGSDVSNHRSNSPRTAAKVNMDTADRLFVMLWRLIGF